MPRVVSIVLYALARILLVIVPFFILLWIGTGLILSAIFAVVIGVALGVIVLGRVQDPLIEWLQQRGSASRPGAAGQHRTAADRDAGIEDAVIDDRDEATATGDRSQPGNGQNGEVTNT